MPELQNDPSKRPVAVENDEKREVRRAAQGGSLTQRAVSILRHVLRAITSRLRRNKRVLPPVGLTIAGVLFIAWSSVKLTEVFSESDSDAVTQLMISNDPECETPHDVGLMISLGEDAVRASVFPSYGDDPLTKPSCLRIGAAQPFSIPAGLTEVWGNAELSKPPEVRRAMVSPSSELWLARVFFPLPPKPDAQGWQAIPRNKAMTIVFSQPISRPDYVSAMLNMSVSVVPLLGPKVFSIRADKSLEFKSFRSSGNSHVERNELLTVQFNRGLALFKASFTDRRRQRFKDIYLLVAGGLLMLGVGCIVDAAMKFSELASESKRPEADGASE